MNEKYLPLFTSEQAAALDRAVIDSNEVSGLTLMQRAGACTFNALMSKWPDTKQILILCGTGNNGGDGYVIAKLARVRNLQVTVIQLGDSQNQSEDANTAKAEMLAEDILLEQYVGQTFENYDVIVDALLGIGLTREVSGVWAEVIDKVNASSASVVAVDIPSGLSANTGNVLGCAIRADLTVTFMARKIGLYTADGKNCCGTIRFDALDVPASFYDSLKTDVFLIDTLPSIPLFQGRLPNTHKGNYGHVLVIGGAPGMSGAVGMAAISALRSGAGLVTVATHPDHAAMINNRNPEIMSAGVLVKSSLDELLEKADVIVIGPGLGRSHWAEELFLHCITIKKPIVIDADGLRILAENQIKSDNWILTPHPGEASALLNESVVDIQQNRYAASRALCERYAGVTVLKGAGTIISGRGQTIVNTSGNPGMSTAGMGDILSGIIGGFLAQSRDRDIEIQDVVAAAVYVHGLAGDMVADTHGEIGMLATDLLEFVRKIINQRA